MILISYYDSFIQVILPNEMTPAGQATFSKEVSVLDIPASLQEAWSCLGRGLWDGAWGNRTYFHAQARALC